MTDTTKATLSHFAGIDTWSTSHPSDAERFYDFICTAYREHDYEISMDEFLDCFPTASGNKHFEEIAHGLYGRYEEGVAVLRHYNKD